MNGKETEKLTGISRRNLRFYEDQGLIEPLRNPENDYREYSKTDIEKLKIIRGLRTIDVPLELIKDYFDNKITLNELSKMQEDHLLNKQKEVETALTICKSLQSIDELKGNTVDSLLNEMDKPENKKNLFDEWKNDFKLTKEIADKEFFYFYPEKAVENKKDMTLELCRYADKNGYTLDIIKEGMRCDFILNGIEYTAYCSNSYNGLTSNVFFPEICCEAKNNDSTPLTKKQKLLKAFHSFNPILLATILFTLIWLGKDGLLIFTTVEFWIIFSIAIVILLITHFLIHRKNTSTKKSKKEKDK